MSNHGHEKINSGGNIEVELEAKKARNNEPARAKFPHKSEPRNLASKVLAGERPRVQNEIPEGTEMFRAQRSYRNVERFE